MAMMMRSRKMMPMTAPADSRSDPFAGLIFVYGFSSSIIRAAKEKTQRSGCFTAASTSASERELPSSPSPLTLITSDAFISGAAVAGSSHIVTGSIVQALTQLLAAVAKCTSRTLCIEKTWFREFIEISALRG